MADINRNEEKVPARRRFTGWRLPLTSLGRILTLMSTWIPLRTKNRTSGIPKRCCLREKRMG